MLVAVLRSSTWVNAPVEAVGAALRHTRTAEVGLRAVRVRGWARTSAGELLVPGDEISFRAAGVPALRTRVVRADAEAFASTAVAGPLLELGHETTLAPELPGSGARTLLTDELRWRAPLGFAGRCADAAFARRFARAVLARRTAAVRALAESWAQRRIVVGAAIVHNGRLLAQQRSYPERDAGRWELPGGRVEPGESEVDAVVRECAEELDVAVVPGGRIGTDVPLRDDLVLRLHRAALAEKPPDGGSGPRPAGFSPAGANPVEPRPVEHRALRWVGAAELAELDWLEADRLLVPALRALLS